MNWNGLKVVLAIFESGSLTGAARQLGINHSTAFRQLNAFERELGGKLFERSDLGYRPTPLGQETLAIAQNIGAHFDDLERTVVGKELLPRGQVKVTCPSNLAYRYIPRYLSKLRQQYPDIEVHLLANNHIINMNSRMADVAVRVTPQPPDHLVGRRVARIPWSVFCSSRMRVRPQEAQALLAQHPVIGATGELLELPAFSWVEEHCQEQIIARADNLVAASYLAEHLKALVVLPNDQIRPQVKALTIFDVAKTSDLWLLTHPDLRNSERIRLVMQALKKGFENEAF